MPRRLWAVVLAVVVVGAAAAVFFTDPGTAGSGTAIGQVAPNFTLRTSQGKTVNLSDFRGRPVLINFWASWCGPCKAELPALEEVHQSLGSKAVILGVNLTVEENGARLPKAFLAKYGLTFPILLDQTGKVAVLYQVAQIPTTYVVNAKGVIVAKFDQRGDFSSFDRALKSAL